MSEPTNTQEITVQGLLFTAPAPYAEGHALTAREAEVLNQTLGENLRNNFATKVKAAKDAAGEAGLSAETISKLRSEFATYADDYEFAGKRQSRLPIDPITREARKIAGDILVSHLDKKGLKKKDLPEGKFDELVAGLLERRPEITEEAKRRVGAIASAAEDSLGDLDIPAKAAE